MALSIKERNKLKQELYKSLTESVRSVFEEFASVEETEEETENTPIYTINVYNIETEESYDDMLYASTYYNEEEATEDAFNFASHLMDDPDLICVSVYAGEYEKPNGDILGEPYDIFTVSNKNRKDTIRIRKEHGYVSGEVDVYAPEEWNG